MAAECSGERSENVLEKMLFLWNAYWYTESKEFKMPGRCEENGLEQDAST